MVFLDDSDEDHKDEADNDNDERSDEEGEVDDTFYSPSKISAEEWGSKHPDGRKIDVRKVQWSQAEIRYIKNWCDQTSLDHPQWQHTIRSKCLSFILKDPKARPIFHPNHIINGRITHGYNVAYGLN